MRQPTAVPGRSRQSVAWRRKVATRVRGSRCAYPSITRASRVRPRIAARSRNPTGRGSMPSMTLSSTGCAVRELLVDHRNTCPAGVMR
jgi:hypothetical protein